MSQSRFLAPYLLVAAAICGLDGVLLGSGGASAPAVYAMLLLAILVTCAGAVRWEQRDIRNNRR